MAIFKKNKINDHHIIIKTYTLLGYRFLIKEKTPTKCKYTFFGIKVSKKRASQKPAFPLVKTPPIRFPKQAIYTSYTSPTPIEKKHHRIAIFASFSKEATISPYVIYYLNALQDITDAIIFVADNPIYANELKKLPKNVKYALFSRHKEYDFGSYKRGYKYAKKQNLLKNAKEVIFCNDSCYGPIYNFRKIFTQMTHKKCDFWGLLSNTDFTYHLQSYFLVFRNSVIQSNALENFLAKVKKEKTFWDVVYNYEVKLTAYLQSKGFKEASYLPNTLPTLSHKNATPNKTVYPLSLIKDYHFPLVKLKCFNNGFANDLQESPLETLEYIKTKSPTLYHIIIDDLKEKNLLTTILPQITPPLSHHQNKKSESKPFAHPRQIFNYSKQ